MKLFVMYASIFVLAFGMAAGLTVVTKADIPYCKLAYEPFEWCSLQTGENCQSPTPHYLYMCDGRYSKGDGPCDCTLIGCCP